MAPPVLPTTKSNVVTIDFKKDRSGVNRYERLQLTSATTAHLDSNKECSFTADIPRGSALRPVAMSPIEDGAKSTASPISEIVMPDACSARTLEDQEVDKLLMANNIRLPVYRSQRLPGTVFRLNAAMKGHHAPLHAKIGERARYWRLQRGLTETEVAKRAGIPYSTYCELENVPRNKTKNLNQLAAVLGLNPVYLETGKGEPENLSASLVIAHWPLDIDPALLDDLSPIERKYAALKLTEVLQEIAASKPRIRKPNQ